MEARIIDNKAVISLSDQEVLDLKEGQRQGTRSNVLMPDAKIEVFPLSAIEEDKSGEYEWNLDRRERAEAAHARAQFDTTGDLRLFVPYLKLTDLRVPGFTLRPEQVEITEPNYAEELRRLIPPEGIVVGFGGGVVSYKVVSKLV